MTKRLLSLFLGTIGMLGVASSAQAVHIVEITGNNISFFYDSDFWGTNNATVNGSTLTFNTQSLMNVDASVSGVKGRSREEVNFVDQVGIIAVAHKGYSVSSKVTDTTTSSAQFSTGSGFGTMGSGFRDFGGQYANGTFTPAREDYSGYSWHMDGVILSTSAVKTRQDTGAYSPAPWYDIKNFQAVKLKPTFTVTASQTNRGDTFSSIDSMQYQFFVTSLPPVPEPETYAMLLAGLGVVAFARRRAIRN